MYGVAGCRFRQLTLQAPWSESLSFRSADGEEVHAPTQLTKHPGMGFNLNNPKLDSTRKAPKQVAMKDPCMQVCCRASALAHGEEPILSRNAATSTRTYQEENRRDFRNLVRAIGKPCCTACVAGKNIPQQNPISGPQRLHEHKDLTF